MVETSTMIPGSLVWGHASLAACAALYLSWWWTFFNPNLPKATGALYAMGVGFIVGAVVLGIAAVALIVTGLSGLSASGRDGSPVPSWAFAVGGVLAYFALRSPRRGSSAGPSPRSFCCSCCGQRSNSPC